MSSRVYLPVTSSTVAALVADGRLPGPLRAHAVTGGLRAAWPEGDDDSYEYAALMAAADDSAGLRSADDAPRRWVLAVDVASYDEVAGEVPTLVEVPREVRRAQVAAAHVDTEDWGPDGPDPDEDLAWFATQEIPDLL